MKGQIVLVTGATDGIGRQTALDLTKLGATVIVHGRTQAKAEATAAEIRKAHKKAIVHVAAADLAAPDQIRAMAADVSQRFGKLHVLVNNAGVFMHEKVLTRAGHEATFMVNHLAPMLLTHALLAALEAAGGARVVNVSSIAHNRAPLDFDNLDAQKSFDGYATYAVSKLGNVLFTYGLADRYPPDVLAAFALHPGVIDTKLLRDGFGMRGADLVSGAQTSVYAASSPELQGLTGRYFQDGRMTPSSTASRDPAARDRLWAESTRRLGITWA